MPYSLCGTSVANLGQQACDVSRGVLKKIFIFNGEIGEDDYASEDDFFATMVANSKLSKNAANKVFVFQEAQDLADASDANKEGSLNLGFKTTLVEGKPGYKIKIFAGTDLAKRMRTFNNKTIRIIEFDSNGVFWGCKSGTKFKGFQARVFVTGSKIATGQNVEEGVIEITVSIISNSEYYDNAYWMEIGDGNNVEDIQVQLDLQLKYISNATNVFKIAFQIPGSNLKGPYNPYDEIAAALAALTFTAGTGTNYGTSLAITSIAVDATLKCLTVTFSATPYGNLTNGDKIKLSGPSVATLDAADITETEVIPVILVKS